MREGKSDEEICDYLKNLLFFLISDSIYNKTRTFVSINSENLIDEFSKNVINKELKESFEKRFNEYIDNECKKILQEILEKNRDKINEYSLSEDKIKKIIVDSIKENKIIYQSLYQRAWISYIKKYFDKICKIYVDAFILVHEDFKNYIKKLVKERFDEIGEKLNLQLEPF